MEPTSSQLEEQRNRLLRRADWRFLLFNPQPGKSVCFSNGSLAQAAASISGQARLPAEVQGKEVADCDLALVVNPSRSGLAEAWNALCRGGELYGEWYSPLAGGPRGVRRQLEAAGFRDITCYWPWPLPNHSPALFWLPLESPRALDYFLANRPPVRSAAARVFRALTQFVWKLGLRTGRLAPVCATARKPLHAGQAAPAPNRADGALPGGEKAQAGFDENGLLAMIRARWADWGLGPVPGSLDWLLLTGGNRSINKVVGLVFAEPGRTPQLVVKFPRVPESIPALAREADVLRIIQSGRPGGMPGAPRVLFFEQNVFMQHGFKQNVFKQHAAAPLTAAQALPVLGETVCSGSPLLTQLRPENFRRFALQVTDWLVELARVRQGCPRADWWERLVEPALADFNDQFGPVVEPAQLEATRKILATLGDLPLVCEQRDCSPWNILLDSNGELVVLDWESAEPQGLPVLDLVYFLTYLSFFLDKAFDSGHFLQSYRKTLDPASFTGRVAAECQRRYIEATGLKADTVRPLRLLAWLIHSRSDYKKIIADTAGRPGSQALRQSLFLQLWEEELKGSILAGGEE